ncbi:glycosyltransferase [Clostridium formicaceticum]|nr:glycosyltransferase [Clostridium formicaceticum]
MPTVVCVSSVNYEWMYQRPQQLMRGLSERGWRVIYCNKTQRKDKYLEALSENLTICHDMKRLIESAEKADVVWVIDPRQRDLKGLFKEKLFLYDCVDDFPFLQNDHYKMLKIADIVLATSNPLYHAIAKYRKDLYLVPNGCDYKHFSERNKLSIDCQIKNALGIIGYIGALAPWVDYKLLELIAAEKPKHTLLLVGASLGNIAMPKKNNIVYVGHQSYDKVPSFLSMMDVTLIPFRKNKITYATNPIKMYEYLSQGKPIVSAALPEVMPFARYLYVAKNHKDFIDHIDKALVENDSEILAQRKEIARRNAWEKRIDNIEEIISSYLRKLPRKVSR